MPHDTAFRVPSWLHNVPFVLFLGGILGYGGSFAFSMLTKFDLINLIRDVNIDDSFYYFKIAQYLADGFFSTFDGGITRTNGYHPIWLLLITPMYWVFDAESALFAIKAFEIMLVSTSVTLVALAARLARLPWILLFTVLPIFLSNRALFGGMEAAAGLFWLAMFLLSLVLFARSPDRWRWLLAVVAFTLPWVRLEYVAISLAGTSLLCLIERSWKKRDGLACAISTIKAGIPFFSAGAGILVYFAYNWLVFDGLVPVSGAIKQLGAQSLWVEAGGYDVVQSFKDFLHVWIFNDELLVALEICAYLVLVWSVTRRSRSREDWLMLTWMVGVFSLAAGHLAKFAQSVLTMHPAVGAYGWYFGPAYLMMALILPLRCYLVIWLIRRFGGRQDNTRRMAELLRLGVVIVGVVFLFRAGNVMEPFTWLDGRVKASEYEWEVASYAGTRIMNRLLPEGSVVGSSDTGVIGYFSRFPVVNVGGFVNDYDFFRKRRMTFGAYDGLRDYFREMGITHTANLMDVERDDERKLFPVLFNGAPLSYDGGFFSQQALRFKLLSVETSTGPGDEFDRVPSFWDRVEPHFDYRFRSKDLGVIIDGRLALSIARDCGPDERRERWIILQWTTGADETGSALQHPWRNQGKIPWACGDLSLLPMGVTHPLRVALRTEDDPQHALGSFEDGLDDWRLDGDAVTIEGQHERTVGQQPISGNVGRGFLNSYHPTRGDAVTGTARSPAFTTADGSLLTFLIAGGSGDGVGVRLLADGAEVTVWRGKDTEHFEPAAYLLAGLAGKTLQLELFDAEVGGWGHIMLDHVRLVRAVQQEAAR